MASMPSDLKNLVAWLVILILFCGWKRKRWCHCRFFVLIAGAIIVILLLCPSTSQRNLVKWEGDMLRAQCRSMRDGTEGWVRSSGGMGKWVNVGTSSSWRHRSRCSFGTSSFKAVHSRSLWRATRVRRGTSRKKTPGCEAGGFSAKGEFKDASSQQKLLCDSNTLTCLRLIAARGCNASSMPLYLLPKTYLSDGGLLWRVQKAGEKQSRLIYL